MELIKDPFFTIVIPLYNKGKYITRCVDSILSQSFTSYEVIIIDDGSMDQSGGIVETIAIENRDLRIIHQVNGGAFSARRIGLIEGKGKYYLFLDADDCLVSDSLLMLYQKANMYPADIIICDIDDIISGDIPKPKKSGICRKCAYFEFCFI